MNWTVVRASCLFAILATAPRSLCATDALPKIISNDNRLAAGELHSGTLNLSLELGEGLWHPENDDGQALPVYAFGEMGKSLQNPGPLIRMRQGTEVRITLHNSLPVAATVHGLHERPGSDKDSLSLPPGGTQEVHFNAGAAGTFYYWASTSGNALDRRMPIESQMAGAFIVDPPGTIEDDRIFVVGVWYKEVPFRAAAAQLATINGKSWPYTERFMIQMGETVRWRWLNPSVMNHGMHLHGFYYHVQGIGDGESYQRYADEARPLVVTQYMERGAVFDMTWVPDRAGRWLFHCHMMMHLLPPQWRALADRPDQTAAATVAGEHPHPEGKEAAGMGGLVLGITVRGDATRKPDVWHAERKLQLEISQRAGSRPRYAIQVREANGEQSGSPGVSAPQLIGPLIVLTQGQPVEINVVNHSAEPTAIHWHGIELESYYDGVAGWTGAGEQTTPPVQPGQSFEVRMTPPRAGTFIYHTHWHDQDQLQNALYGPLIVLPAGQKFDPLSDKVFLFSAGEFEPFGEVLLINGHAQPSPLRVTLGTKYRFRFINISANHVGMMVSLRRAGIPVDWRIIAKDGAALPPPMLVTQKAEMRITVGESYDVEYQANSPSELALEVYLPGPRLRVTQALIVGTSPSGN